MAPRLAAAVIAAFALLAALGGHAQQPYPSKPIHIVSPFSPGLGPDTQVRHFAATLSPLLSQPVVVDNVPGASGVVATQSVARAAPDGYMLLITNLGTLILKHLKPDIGYDPVADFAPITEITTSPLVLSVRADHPARRIEDLIASAKTKSGKVSYGSGGVGSPSHLAAATFGALAGVDMTHVPYKGAAGFLTALMSGDVDFAFFPTAAGMPQFKAGKLRPLAITSNGRWSDMPDVPPLNELMRSDLAVMENWSSLWAPAKIPVDVMRRLHAAAVKAVADPALKKQTEALGSTPSVPSASPEAYGSEIRRENDKWRQIVKLSGAKID